MQSQEPTPSPRHPPVEAHPIGAPNRPSDGETPGAGESALRAVHAPNEGGWRSGEIRSLVGEIRVDDGSLVLELDEDGPDDFQSPTERPRVRNVTPIERHALQHVFAPTRLGEKTLSLIGALMQGGTTFQHALNSLAEVRAARPLGKFIRDLAEDVEGGQPMAQALEKRREVFGDLAVELLRRCSSTHPTAHILHEYCELRSRQKREFQRGDASHFSLRTRVFALTLDASLNLTNEVYTSLRLASLEHPRRFRRRMAEALDVISAGEELGDALPVRGILRAGFEQEFVDLIQAAGAESTLSPMLRWCASA